MLKTNRIGQILREWMEISTRRSIHDFALFSRKQGMSLLQLSVLFHIRFRGACGVTDIANDFGISKAAASQLLERLVLQEYVSRSESPSDRRVKEIELTEKAVRLLEQSIVERQKWIDSLVATFSTEERDLSESVISMLIEHSKQLRLIENGNYNDDFRRLGPLEKLNKPNAVSPKAAKEPIGP
jgi:DNA-binding MarR family transcriptional regulator